VCSQAGAWEQGVVWWLRVGGWGSFQTNLGD